MGECQQESAPVRKKIESHERQKQFSY